MRGDAGVAPQVAPAEAAHVCAALSQASSVMGKLGSSCADDGKGGSEARVERLA